MFNNLTLFLTQFFRISETAHSMEVVKIKNRQQLYQIRRWIKIITRSNDISIQWVEKEKLEVSLFEKETFLQKKNGVEQLTNTIKRRGYNKVFAAPLISGRWNYFFEVTVSREGVLDFFDKCFFYLLTSCNTEINIIVDHIHMTVIGKKNFSTIV